MPLTPARFLTTWQVDPLLLLPAALAVAYLVLAALGRRGDRPWPWWRTTVFVLGTAVLAWATNGWPAVARADPLWAGTLSVGLCTAVVPLLLALGDPVTLWEAWRQRPVPWVRGRVARVLMFPVLASVLAAVVVTLVFTTGWFAAATTDRGAWAGLQVTVLAVGLLVNVPLLSEDLLPAWCTPGLRTLFAFTDGVADAVPGVVVMTSIDWVAGGTLLAAAEAVGVPMILVVLRQWVRADEAEARETDAALDLAAAERAARWEADADRSGGAATGLERPWWESDPRLAHRFRRSGPED